MLQYNQFSITISWSILLKKNNHVVCNFSPNKLDNKIKISTQTYCISEKSAHGWRNSCTINFDKFFSLLHRGIVSKILWKSLSFNYDSMNIY